MARRFTSNQKQARTAIPQFTLEDIPLWPNENGFLRLVNPDYTGIDPVIFVKNNKTTIQRWLNEDGACLLRGFDIKDAKTFAKIVAEFGELLPYIERAAKRTEVVPGVFTSTELSSDVAIPQHHEMSYASIWPEQLYFWCEQPPTEGGCTPLASERVVTSAIDDAIKQKFTRLGLRYIRNFHNQGLDLTWSNTFGTDDPKEVSSYAKKTGVDLIWSDDYALKTLRDGPTFIQYPHTGESLWFNHVHLFHPTNLEPSIRQSLLNKFGIDAMPRDVRFSTGEIIPDKEVISIKDTYERHSHTFQWQAGDLLLLNNFLVTHGRQAFTGERRILVAMTGLHNLQNNDKRTLDE